MEEDIRITDLVNIKSPFSRHPSLKQHQSALVHRCRSFEIERGPGGCGILADMPGAGKSRVVLALCEPGTTNVIVTPRSRLSNWLGELDQFPHLSHSIVDRFSKTKCTKGTVVSDLFLIIDECFPYFRQMSNVHRVFMDEADSLRQAHKKKYVAGFTWLVTSAYPNILFHDGLSLQIRGRVVEFAAGLACNVPMRHAMRRLKHEDVVKCEDAWVRDTMNILPLEDRHIFSRQPTCIRKRQTLATVLPILQDGNMEAVLDCLDVDMTCDISKESDCGICLEPTTERSAFACCGRVVFCARCALLWLQANPRCPICRKPSGLHDLRLQRLITTSVDEAVSLDKVATFVALLRELLSEGRQVCVLDSCVGDMRQVIRENIFRMKDVIGFVSARNTRERSGPDMAHITDVVTFEHIDEHASRKLIGRMNRPGRKVRLRVWHILLRSSLSYTLKMV
jgi:Ring finger domain